MKLQVSEKDGFFVRVCIYTCLSRLLGQKNFDFNIIFKKTKISMLLRSTKKCPQCFTCSASFN